ncbi:TIGR03086 family metal-binding protein [Streptomyces sp. PSKA30]|uniref:TIGR03086 family metal-binding protein n=1 Tax=Streptomyces sp. PSKA30 TaxID=2874597 RepID=UPI001CD11802|nr:TIGR03086 family metal-binding protein [Streptomyces sp. PSKA30]MBZ9644422.1 TIGR03086 family protein [Streptomyces sp. PSKA30]
MDTNSSEAPSRSLGDLLTVARERAVPVVRAIPDEALAAPTPCAEYDVKALVNHLFQVVVEFQKLAAKGESDFSATPDRVGAGPDWRERFAEETDKLVAAWSAPGAEEGAAGAWKMPARLVGSMALLDLTVHVWDLARATGQEYRADGGVEPVLEQLTGTVAELAPTARKTGVFAEPVPVGEQASPFERLLAQTGRDPHWASAV